MEDLIYLLIATNNSDLLQIKILPNIICYLDPGTGSLIFQFLIAAFCGGLFTVKLFWKNIKLFFVNLLKSQKYSIKKDGN